MIPIPVPDEVLHLMLSGAMFAINDSGGKDSQAMRILLSRLVAPSQLVVVHASLGEVEWAGALEHAQDGARRCAAAFIVARSNKTFLQMVESRFRTRPSSPCWPSSACRQCTSDLKRDPIARELRRFASDHGYRAVVNCMGIRAEESASRAKALPLRKNARNSTAAREWWDWYPIHLLTRQQVFKVIAEAGEKPHRAYAMGNDRLSCKLCIFGSKGDLRNGAIEDPENYRRYVQMEQRTGYTMHQSRVALPVLTGIPVDDGGKP